MSDSTEIQRSGKGGSISSDDHSLLAIDIQGKDPEIWAHQKPRLYTRIANSVKDLFSQNNDIPPQATANEDIKETIENLAYSAKAKLQSPQLANLERQANINVKLAEVKEREANARKIALEADRLEMDIEREKVHESQKMINILIQRGQLSLVEHEGEMCFILNRLPSNVDK
jgi:hypothetical protein